MIQKIEITIDVIIHATEDISKIFQAFDDVFKVKKEDCIIEETLGHYENPIILLNVNIRKKQAQNFMNKLLGSLPEEQVNELIDEIDERTVDSRFHLRLDKQELIKGNVIVKEKGTIKLKIHTPIYNKKDTIKTFSEILQIVN